VHGEHTDKHSTHSMGGQERRELDEQGSADPTALTPSAIASA
jgi:hypothetical protein